MPAIRILVWNIQDFGAARAVRGNYVAMCNFIAGVAAGQQADVLVIEELKSGGVAHLPTLAAALNNRAGGAWVHDYIRGALSRPRAQHDNSVNDTAWDDDHAEGYALFWNNARAHDFTLAAAPNNWSAGCSVVGAGIPARALTLVSQGRAQGALTDHGWFNAPTWNQGAPNAGSNLDFGRSNPLLAGAVTDVGARRPCAFTLNLDPGNTHNQPATYLIPVIVYHATSNARSRSFNTQLAGYSRQMYQAWNPSTNLWINATNAVIAGDFNVDARVDNAERDAYTVFTETHARGGSACVAGFAPLGAATPQTTVQVRRLHVGQGEDPQIRGNTAVDFHALAIDHYFGRLSANAPIQSSQVQRVDLLGSVMGMPAERRALISEFWGIFLDRLNGMDPNGNYINWPRRTAGGTPMTAADEPVMGDVVNWDNFRMGCGTGNFTRVNTRDNTGDARAAAEFVNKLISDHLPILLTLNF